MSQTAEKSLDETVRDRCRALVDLLPASALPEAEEDLAELRNHWEAIDRVQRRPKMLTKFVASFVGSVVE